MVLAGGIRSWPWGGEAADLLVKDEANDSEVDSVLLKKRSGVPHRHYVTLLKVSQQGCSMGVACRGGTDPSVFCS